MRKNVLKFYTYWRYWHGVAGLRIKEQECICCMLESGTLSVICWECWVRHPHGCQGIYI